MQIFGYSITRRRKASRRKTARSRTDTRRVIRQFLHTLELLAQARANGAAHADA